MSGDARLSQVLGPQAVDELKRRASSLAQEAEEERHDDRVGLLLFGVGEEWYAVRVSEVREIYQEYDVTPIPCVPPHVLGVVNIRGEIVSVTDLARVLGSGAPASLEGLPAIVLHKERLVTAAVVDVIGDIVEVAKDSLEPPVSMIGKAQAEYVSGSVYVEDRLVGIMNVGRLLQPVGGEG